MSDEILKQVAEQAAKQAAERACKQKEQHRRSHLLLLCIIISILGLPWLLLLAGGIRVRQQQAQLDIRSDAFFAQIQNYPQNASAQAFDRLSADLGFSSNALYSPQISINAQAAQAYRSIEKSLNRFLDEQSQLTADPITALTPDLKDYLNAHQRKISAVEQHLLAQAAPRWSVDLDQMFDIDYGFPGFTNVLNVQKLLLLSALNSSQTGQTAEVWTALEASWQLNQTLSQRPDLTSQVLVSVVTEKQAALLRHLNNVPPLWRSRLDQQIHSLSIHPSALDGLRFETWLQYKISKKSLATILAQPAEALSEERPKEQPEERTDNHLEKLLALPTQNFSERLLKSLSAQMSYWFSPAYYSQLIRIEALQAAQRAFDQLDRLNVCSTTRIVAEQVMQAESTSWHQAIAVDPFVTAQRWKLAGDRQLNLELTQKVLQAKQAFQTSRQWPATLPNLTSQACPNQHWLYERSNNNQAMSLSLSPSNIVEPSIPLSYRSATELTPTQMNPP
ncbi:MAG: hypothetical protein DCF15_19100 [Phormidesmis priestleyi]|uniref:Uncharacterized protein n=1 Tax=Phormidesmis priestleyi TaxID=268141 RepID=A0A2W4YX48_9CYAN|nr:MAG: hypothetical protein DCF15_19100 [Phormidesmis priestleyi]